MAKHYNPLESEEAFEKLTKTYHQFMQHKESFQYLTFSFQDFTLEKIIELTRNHKEAGLDYYVYEDETDGEIKGILTLKRSFETGLELFLLLVDPEERGQGIGQQLINKCIEIGQQEGYKSIDAYVFADNKRMLLLTIKNDFIPIRIKPHARADGMDLVHLKYYINT